MSRYRCYGLKIRSDIELDELAPAEGTPDIDIELAEVASRLERSSSSGVYFQASEDEFMLHLDGVARYLVTSGRTIRVHPQGELDDTRFYLYGTPLAALLQQRGALVLQGSAVRTRWGALVLVGAPAAGKSCLAAALREAGCDVLTDDVCVITLDPPTVHPGPRFLCLWGGDVERFGIREGARRVRNGVDRFIVPVSDPGPEAVPLYAVCCLDTWYKHGAQVQAVDGAERAAVILGSIHSRPVREQLGGRDLHLRHLAGLGPEIPVVRAWRQRGAQRIEPLVTSLCAALDL